MRDVSRMLLAFDEARLRFDWFEDVYVFLHLVLGYFIHLLVSILMMLIVCCCSIIRISPFVDYR